MASIVKCSFCDPNIDNINLLRSYLPEEYEYVVCSFNANNADFKTRLRTNGKHQDYAHKWLEDFQMHSKCTMRVERTYPHSGTKNIFKIDLRCQHNTRPRSEKVRERESCKNTDCPAKMGITIKRVVTERKSRSKDPHLPDYPTVIQMNFCHNHDILTPEILKHRSVLPEVKEKILHLFKLGHNPSTALDMHKYDLLLEYGENFEKICHDRALLPDAQFCYRLYYKILKKEEENSESETPATTSPHKKSLVPLSNCENSSILNSAPMNDQLLSSAEKKAKKKRKLENTVVDKKELSKQISAEMYKFCKAGGIAGMLQINDNDSVMALCTPLMLRVHSFLKYSGEVVFVDSYGELGEPNSCRVYLFVTYSCIGALPLGCVVTTSATATCMKSALDLWKQILPSRKFFSKSDGPDIFYTDDNDSEKQALKMAFPKSHILICISHILHATWTFLLDRKNTIKREHRSLLFSKIKMLLFSQSVEELEMYYAYAVGDNVVKSNAIFLDYLNHVYNQRHNWSLVFCRDLLPRANDLSIFWESAMVILKDPILSRTRTYNLLQALDFISRLDTYYERKLIDLANNRYDSVCLSRFLLIDVPHEAYTITQYSEIEYEVHNDSKDTAYQVDVSLGACECRTGKTGAPCKHQLLVFRNFAVPVYDCMPPNTPIEKNLLLLLATGHSEVAESSTEGVSKVVSTTMQYITQKTLYTNTEISVNDLEACTETTFLLDDSGEACNSLNSSPILNQPLSIPPNEFVQSNSSLERLATVTAQDTSTMSSQDVSVVSAQDSLLSAHNLFSQLDSQQISLNNDLSSSLDHHLSADTSAEPTTFSEPQSENVSEIVDLICSELKQRTSKSPSMFKPALHTFLKNLERLSSNSSLEYALYSFGKFSKSAVPLFKRKIADNKLIGLQSTGELKKKKNDIKLLKNIQSKV